MNLARFFKKLDPGYAHQTGQKRQIQADPRHTDLGAENMGLLYPKRTNLFTKGEKRIIDPVSDGVAEARRDHGAGNHAKKSRNGAN